MHAQRAQVASACPPHHFVIPKANGPTSEGVCRNCDERRTFSNHLERRVVSLKSRTLPPDRATSLAYLAKSVHLDEFAHVEEP